MGRLTRAFTIVEKLNVDWVGIAIILCLGIFGIFLILTINPSLALQQSVFLAIGLILALLVSLLHPAILWWFAPIGYIMSLVLLLSAYIGPSIRGATRWIVVLGVQLQPSEFVKPLLLLFFTWIITKYPPRSLKYIPIHIGVFLLPFLLVMKQPDLGSSMVYASFWIAMMLAGGLPLGFLVISLTGITILIPGIWHLLASYQKARILTFLNPALDPKGASYNAIQSMIAVGSGQLFGRGLGRGTQSHLRFLPEHHTDFIFATLVEELGFVGGFFLLIGYLILFWRIIGPLIHGKIIDIMPFVYTVGLFSMLLSQMFINIGMNMGIVPITGITLPLISYGGSSLLSIGVSFGLLWTIYKGQSIDRTIA
ncbi:rod shape-determining protein RodA [Candidatus Gottesmanbacteria bacterium]|nr:rod shape-determining protein RodA [Candidatus Gottesmanbacteria bacterium]